MPLTSYVLPRLLRYSHAFNSERIIRSLKAILNAIVFFCVARRRSSLQKLHALQLEAPITKVITLLSNAITETTNPETAAQIDKVRPAIKRDTRFIVTSIAIKRYVARTSRVQAVCVFFQAIEILKTTELYVPQLKEDRAMYSDPVTQELVGALLAVRMDFLILPFGKSDAKIQSKVSLMSIPICFISIVLD